jgi:hypothetical protein
LLSKRAGDRLPPPTRIRACCEPRHAHRIRFTFSRVLLSSRSAGSLEEARNRSEHGDGCDVARGAFDLHDTPDVGKDGIAVDRVLKKGDHVDPSVGGPGVFQVAQNSALESIARAIYGLTLRPTRLSCDPNAKDWSVHEDGQEIGRLYEDPTATRPESSGSGRSLSSGRCAIACA